MKNYGVYSDQIRSTLYAEKTLRKLCCKPKGRLDTEDKNNIAYKTDCSNYKTVYFGQSERL